MIDIKLQTGRFVIEFTTRRLEGEWLRSDADDGDRVWSTVGEARSRIRESIQISSEYFTNTPEDDLRRYRVKSLDGGCTVCEFSGVTDNGVLSQPCSCLEGLR